MEGRFPGGRERGGGWPESLVCITIAGACDGPNLREVAGLHPPEARLAAHILPWERALMHTGGRSHGVSHQLRFIECQAQGLAANVLTFCGFCDVQQMVRSGMRAVARSKGLRLPQQMLVSEQQANKLPAPQGGCHTSTSNESCPLLQLMPAAAKWTTNLLNSETAATMLYPEQLRHCRFASEQWRGRRVAMTTECNTRSGMQQTTKLEQGQMTQRADRSVRALYSQ